MDVTSILTEKYSNTERAGGSGSGGVSAENVKLAQAHAERSTLSRHSSKDVSEDGCCLAKIFLSNIVSFAT